MANYLSPGVYLEEVSSGTKPIEGVGSSTAAFVGLAARGKADTAKYISNWTQFVNEFDGFIDNAYLAFAVYAFFAEGGRSCYVVRAIATDAAEAAYSYVGDDSKNIMTVTSNSEGSWANRVKLTVEDPSLESITSHFKLIVEYTDAQSVIYTEVFDNISLSTMASSINNVSNFITVAVETSDPSSDSRPANASDTLTGGSNGSSTPVFIGTEADRKGLHALDNVDNINFIAIADQAGIRDTILGALTYCDNRKDCFFIADPPSGITPDEAVNFKKGTGSYSGNAFNSSYGALYYPWVYVNDQRTNSKKMIPPSGLIAGTYAHTDTVKGVHKAPAGTTDGYLGSVLGIEKVLTRGENDLLNPNGVNAIRSFPNIGICVWGARTLSNDAEWKYINIRRLFMFIEESIDEASQWVVFESNEPSLWPKVIRNIRAFLTNIWRDGALFGKTADEAFRIKVDEENNPQTIRDLGRLIIEVWIAPVKPSEFVIIRISQKTQELT